MGCRDGTGDGNEGVVVWGMMGATVAPGRSLDAEGTLGGLVEAGRRIGEHLVVAVGAARLCSNDPVCAEHGPGAEHDPLRLHGAACCLLVAETSCEQRKDWLTAPWSRQQSPLQCRVVAMTEPVPK
jgi:hypothetical protein